MSPTLLLPDAGPLISLAYANALDVLQAPGGQVCIVGMVREEVTRKPTPTNQGISPWLDSHQIPVAATRTFEQYQLATGNALSKCNLGELAIQETITRLALDEPQTRSVLLFEDDKIARTSFYLPKGVLRVSARVFLQFLRQRGLIESASAIERAAVQAGRQFSALRFPPA